MNNNLLFYGKRVLFIGAHPDDIEIGCGALIAHIVQHTELLCVTLSDNQKNPALTRLVEEHYKSMAVLGVPESSVVLGQFETRRFPHARQEILEYMVNLNRSFQPTSSLSIPKPISTRIMARSPKKPCEPFAE